MNGKPLVLKRRRGMTVLEVLVIGSIGLVTIGVIVSLLSAAWRQDSWTAGRLDAITGIGTALETVRHDLFYANAGQTDPDRSLLALRMQRPGAAQPEYAIYTWEAAGKALTRNGKPLGFARPTGFGVKVEEGTPVFELDIPSSGMPGKPPHQTRLTVPLVIPDACWEQELDYWAPRVN